MYKNIKTATETLVRKKESQRECQMKQKSLHLFAEDGSTITYMSYMYNYLYERGLELWCHGRQSPFLGCHPLRRHEELKQVL